MYAKDVEALSAELEGQADYIFTDPPYGGHISYLDLSTLWNTWLGITPSLKSRETELIVGGELEFTEAGYIERLGKSVAACVRMLKKGRWLSVVFQHWNTAYFEAILSSATEAGADLRATVSQVGDPIWSMHKKKGNQSVLAGEMIITFYKTGKAKRVTTHDGEFDVSAVLGRILSECPAEKVYGEYLFNQMVIEAWRKSAIRQLNITKTDFVNLIKQHGWHYDGEKHYWVKDKYASSAVSLFDAGTSAA